MKLPLHLMELRNARATVDSGVLRISRNMLASCPDARTAQNGECEQESNAE